MRTRTKSLAVLLVSIMFVTAAVASVREEFHKTYPLTAGGSFAIKNVNGTVKISTWDRNEVEVVATKTASSDEKLKNCTIDVFATSSRVEVKTKYVSNWMNTNPATVEYRINVPKGTRIDKAETVNGDVDISDTGSEVRASTVNGSVHAYGASGDLKISTVNGSVHATLARTDHSVYMDSVNGSVELTIPGNADATIEASTVNGNVSNGFGMSVDRPKYGPGAKLHGTLGNGRANIKLSSVNGSVDIRKGV